MLFRSIGVFAPATPGQGGLTAPYPLNGPEVEYVTSGAGVAYAKGTKLLPRTETICSSAKNLPTGFEAVTNAPACKDGVVVAWQP